MPGCPDEARANWRRGREQAVPCRPAPGSGATILTGSDDVIGCPGTGERESATNPSANCVAAPRIKLAPLHRCVDLTRSQWRSGGQRRLPDREGEASAQPPTRFRHTRTDGASHPDEWRTASRNTRWSRPSRLPRPVAAPARAPASRPGIRSAAPARRPAAVLVRPTCRRR